MQENSRLKQENSKIADFITRQSQVSSQVPTVSPSPPSHVDIKTSPPRIPAEQLAGTWDLRFRGSGATGRIGVKFLGDNALEFHGDLSQGDKMPSLKIEGHGKLIGKTIQISFLTRAEDGNHWYGDGEFLIDSATSIRGWYVDQVGRYDTIDVKRSP